MVFHRSRREVILAGGKLVLAGISLGSIEAITAVTQHAYAKEGIMIMGQTASFGWAIKNMGVGGANTFFDVKTALTLNFLTMDVSFVNFSPQPSPVACELLCQVGVSRGAPPTFINAPTYNFKTVASGNFGGVAVQNPLGFAFGPDPVPLMVSQDVLISVTLKTVSPQTTATAAYTSRNVTVNPNLSLNAGDYLVFHMDHSGLTGNAEMQIVLGY